MENLDHLKAQAALINPVFNNSFEALDYALNTKSNKLCFSEYNTQDTYQILDWVCAITDAIPVINKYRYVLPSVELYFKMVSKSDRLSSGADILFAIYKTLGREEDILNGTT